ncbi:alpha/beta hydrolase [Actinomyces sp.]|uniref:alpha/beta hydrolase n=1 Tax=Actinomyces sp. TaxID=29317 RepID=UPI0026DD3347|nr:alpha/beta hydrolase fold domain-containing protein [Actinomyces sp.]MDO4899701.1 alpha/beta hydrolase fold domain-containing protein [Actinomyces sp.]
MRFNSTHDPVVVTDGPEKVGRVAGIHGERIHILDGLPPRGPGFTAEYQARAARYDLPVEPVDLPEVDRRDDAAPGPHGDVPVRVYTPRELSAPDAAGRRGAVVWIHGGAFIFGDLDMPEADHTAARLAHATGLPVISVDYRLAVDGVTHPIPHDDCWAAYQWARAGGHGLPTDPARVAVGGGSAGACLAASVGLHGRDAGQAPAGVFLAYPLVHYPLPEPSAELAAVLATLPPLLWAGREAAAAQNDYLTGQLLGPEMTGVEHFDYAMPGNAESLAGYPRTYIENCEADDLRASGERFSAQLAQAGVDVEQHTVPGETHGHLSVPGLPTAKATCDHFAAFIGDVLR